MNNHAAFAVALAAALSAAAPMAVTAAEDNVTTLTGQEALGSWMADQPGTIRLIRPSDLPAPFVTESASNAPELVSMPQNAALNVPDGFKAEMIAGGFKEPRVIRTAPNGDLFVADSGANEIRVLRYKNGATTPADNTVFANGLDQPYGIAFYPLGPDPKWVYVANTGSVVRYPYSNGDLTASGKPETIIPALPIGYHWTRDLAFSADGTTLFVSVGSGSNIAEEVTGTPEGGIDAFARAHAPGAMWGDELNRAAVLAFDPNGKDMRVYAAGLRNCSGMTMQPDHDALWCVVNERDGLGDNLPPDYATTVAQGAFYGWPWYYIGANPDPRAPLKDQRPDLASHVTVPDVLFQPHSAPLNIAFYDGDFGTEAFPAAYQGDAFVAMHGSWNRDARTGYKVVRLMFEDGKPTGEYQDFITGFVVSDAQVWGRPVGVAIGHDGALYVTEDGAGTIWRVSRDGKPAA